MEKPRISRREAETEIAIKVEKIRVTAQEWHDKGIDTVDPKSLEYQISIVIQREILWEMYEEFCEITEEEAEN